MTDPRNVAHDKKVQQEKKHRGVDIAPGADETPQPGKKPHLDHSAQKAEKAEKAAEVEKPASDEPVDQQPGADASR